jgi:hypothetical protein
MMRKRLYQLIEEQGVREVTVLNIVTQLPELGTTISEINVLVGFSLIIIVRIAELNQEEGEYGIWWTNSDTLNTLYHGIKHASLQKTVLLNKYRFVVIPIRHEKLNRAFKHVLAFAITLGLSFQPCQAVPQQAIVAFRRVGLRLGLRMQRSGNKMLVRLPIICHHRFDSRTLDVRPEPPPRFRVAGAHSAAEEPSPMPVNSRPDPAVVFLCPT